jgi:chemotaxis protein methyltransferase CheR
MIQDQTGAYTRLVELVVDRLGLQPNGHRFTVLQNALDHLLKQEGISHPAELASVLAARPESDPRWRSLIQALTVGETYFYRNQAHIKALQEHVLPQIIAKKRASGSHILRIWSAGCATGEEPYSIAMLLRGLLPDTASWSITILGTDINPEYLERARQGVYRAHSFRGETPDWLQGRWFSREGENFIIDSGIRKMASFAPLNLISEQYPAAHNGTADMDLILCRNVTIYFGRETIKRLHQALLPGGWLIVGHSEPQPEVYDDFETRNFENAVFYQKPLAAKPSVPEWFNVLPPPVTVAPVVPTVAPIVLPKPAQAKAGKSLWDEAWAAANHEDWERAFSLLAAAEDDDAMQPQIHYLRALMQLQMSDTIGAMSSLRQSIYCDPNFALAYYLLGDLHARNGTHGEAHRQWRRAQQVLEGMEQEARVPYGDDLTVEMLHGLLAYRLNGSGR